MPNNYKRKMMATITAQFRGKHEDLEMLLFSGIKNFSIKILAGQLLTVIWHTESTNKEQGITSCMEEVNMGMVELWNCEVVNIG